MEKKNFTILFIVGLLTFGLGWFIHDIKGDLEKKDLGKLKISNKVNHKMEDFSKKISGRFIMKDSNDSGFDFINSSTVLWTNEIEPSQPDTLKIRWLDNSTFMTKSTERKNMDCPPIVSIYQVISFDEKHLILKDIWTGWNDNDDGIMEFIKQINKK